MYMTVWWLTPILPLLVAVAHVLPCAWVWRRAERRGECVELLHLVQATIVVVALLLVEILVGAYVIGFLQLFGIARLLFYHGAITAPLAGALLLFGSRRQRLWALSRPVQSLALAAILCAPLGAWMRFGAPHRLVLEEVTVPARAGAPPTREPITVGVLADLQTDHVGTHERAAVGRLMAQEPDLIVVPGDVYDGPDVREVMPSCAICSPSSRPRAASGSSAEITTPLTAWLSFERAPRCACSRIASSASRCAAGASGWAAPRCAGARRRRAG